VPFTEHQYLYEDQGGTRVASRQLGVDEHSVVKTLVMEDERAQPLLILMHGDREVSTKQLARQVGRRVIRPFGTRKTLPVFVERSILDLGAIYINGGRRGLLVRMAPDALTRVLGATAVDAAAE
jgi:prolyl-tRNA editing enzyme YbaK/EbsC (Cys-tRNA(Pro) deacylase)